MKFFAYFVTPSTLRFCILIQLFILATLLQAIPSNAAKSQKTLVLPLKVVTLGESAKLTKETDSAIKRAATLYKFKYLSRTQAEKLLDYQAEWPPALKVLRSKELLQQYDNIILGSITEVGGQVSLDLKLIDLLSTKSTQFYTTAMGTSAELPQLSKKNFSKIASYASRESIIASIAPAGNNKIDSGAILQQIKTQPGDPYAPVQLRQDLKAIFAMGYFNDIQIEVRQEKDGKAVIFNVKEKSVIKSIEVEGTDEIKEEKVREVVTIKEQSILNTMQVNKDGLAIQQLYKTKGYYNTTVTPQITYPTEESAVVRFKVEEGPKIYIREITFQGNETFDDDDLEDEIMTNTKGWFSWFTESGLLDFDKLNQDAGRLLNFYGNNGFLETKIGDPIVKQEGEWLYITFFIEEGQRLKVGDVDVRGDLIEDKEKLLAQLEISKQEYISRQVLRDDVLKITDIYAEQGYANAIIDPRIHKSVKDGHIDITIEIDKGELVYINRITINGNNRTRDNVIRRELKVEEGGIFNAKAMRDSIQKLQFLEFFEEVSITPEQAFDPTTVDLAVEVKEKSTGMFTVGVGYSSVENIILLGEISENNFLGRGDTLALSTNVGGESSRYNLKYKNPRYKDSMLSWGIDIFDTEREFDDYTKDSIGGSISLGHPLWGKWRGFGSYSYTDTDLNNVSDDASFIIRESQNIKITSAVGLSVVRDTRNRRFGPSSGSKHNLSVRYAGGPLGGDSEFTKLEGSTSWYFPMMWKTVLHLHGAAGQAFENEDEGLPVYERFYLGGLRSIRGFESSKISPTDPETGERIGGDKMWYTNVEVIFPLLAEQGVNGVIFFDAGNVLDDDEDWNVDSVKTAVGGGIRWFSPMGPLRIEWGYNLDPEDDEDQSVWDFSVGGVF